MGVSGGQANTIRSIDGEDHFLNERAIGFGVIDRSAILSALEHLAKVREPEAPGGVEDKVIGAAQAVAIAFGVEDLHFAAIQVHPLDTPAGIALREALRRVSVRGHS